MEPLEVLALGTAVVSMAGVGLAWSMSKAFDRSFARPSSSARSAQVPVRAAGGVMGAKGLPSPRSAEMPATVTARVHFSASRPHV
jgi:hypothetical protein